ncbi:MAG: hypothetical protein MUP15_10195 [Dehalococcoidia bacterium]|nr:hypothetical protein [Dehalococcoidia bacterium]
MTIQTDAEIVPPRYSVRTLEITLAIAACAGTLLGLIWQEPAIQLRVIAGAGVVVGAVVLAHIPFMANWLLCQTARARGYPRLLEAKSQIQNRLADLQAKVALSAGSVPLPMRAFFAQAGQIILVFDKAGAAGVQWGERICVIDDLQRRYRGTALFVDVTTNIVKASLGDSDPLFKGCLYERINANPGMTCPTPEALRGLRENDIEAYLEAFSEAMEEIQYE